MIILITLLLIYAASFGIVCLSIMFEYIVYKHIWYDLYLPISFIPLWNTIIALYIIYNFIVHLYSFTKKKLFQSIKT